MSIPEYFLCPYCGGQNDAHLFNCPASFTPASKFMKQPEDHPRFISLADSIFDKRVDRPSAVLKPSNPKDRIGSAKLPVSLVPDTVLILAAQAFAEGASKYGAYNWRVAGVRFSIYMEAMRRHQMKLWNGEWADKKTKVPHLASIIACAAIIEDARACGKLTDDRPPALDVEPLIDQAEAVIAHVTALNASHKPHHHVIDGGMAA